jgi:hypothetical protein
MALCWGEKKLGCEGKNWVNTKARKICSMPGTSLEAEEKTSKTVIQKIFVELPVP